MRSSRSRSPSTGIPELDALISAGRVRQTEKSKGSLVPLYETIRRPRERWPHRGTRFRDDGTKRTQPTLASKRHDRDRRRRAARVAKRANRRRT